MYRETHKKRLVIDAGKLDISNYLRTFLQKLSTNENRLVKINNKGTAERVRQLLNIPQNNQFMFGDMQGGYTDWDAQEVDYVQSNLGDKKGYLFYFICRNCGRRVKYLYSLYSPKEPFCRTCLRLQYKHPSRRERNLSYFFNKKYLSTEQKYMAMKKLGITKDDIANYLSDYKNDV